MPHSRAVLHIVKNLKDTLTQVLFYPADSTMSVTGYYDADWGCCAFSGRSLTGYCIYIGGALVSWKTKKQKTIISKSSAEYEYRSMSQTASELVWMNVIFEDLHVDIPNPITMTIKQHITLPKIQSSTKEQNILN